MTLTRRNLLALLPAALPAMADTAKKPLRGIFPIMQTPFTADDKLDLPVLAKQAHFLERCGVHGMVWPQLASEYMTLSTAERMAGMEALMEASRGARAAMVLGVQANDARQAVSYAQAATRLGADALIALPPQGEEDETKIVAYYRAIGEASPLPLCIQAVGKMSVDLVVKMSQDIPTLRFIKDEAGPVHSRITQFRKRAPELLPFTGNHGRTLYEEMVRGSAGTMPAVGFADLYVAAWDLFEQGDRKQAAEFCSRFLLLVSEVETWGIESLKYLLQLRGVFPNYRTRLRAANKGGEFDNYARQTIQEMLDHLKPYLRV